MNNPIGTHFGSHSAIREYLGGNDQLDGLDLQMDDMNMGVTGAGQVQIREDVGAGHTDVRRNSDGSVSDVYTPQGGHLDLRYSSGKVSDIYYNGQHADFRWSNDQLSDLYLDGNHLDMRYSGGHVSDIYTNGGHLDIRSDAQGHVTDTYGGCTDLDVSTTL